MSSKKAVGHDRRRSKPDPDPHPSPFPPSQQPREPNMAAPSFGSTPAGKVAIPPLHPRLDPTPATVAVEKKRTPKACVECRLRKIKCSGKRPTCEHCEQCQVPCVYAEGKREQNKRATERSDRLLQLLRDISLEITLPPHLSERVRSVDFEVPDDDQSVRTEHTATSKKRRQSSATTTGGKRARSPSSGSHQGEDDIAADVGSEESIDLAAEDFNRNEKTRATGFIGKNSEVAWAQRLAQVQAYKRTGHSEQYDKALRYGRPGTTEDAMTDRLYASRIRHSGDNKQNVTIADYSYHLDSESILMVDYVDKDELPPPETAEQLVRCYMDTVQDAWPILTRLDILNQFQHYLRSKNQLGLPTAWRAILNMVFAIGAKFSHLVGAPWRGDERDHLVYYTRAMSLAVPNDAIVAHPDLQRIQTVGLISFYYLTISRVSRSWIMVGLACRQAMALGLHLRNMDPSTHAISKEKRVRVWWSLYTLEYLLCEFTGRPTAIDHRFRSVPAPAPVDETNLVTSPAAKQLEEWCHIQASTPNSSKKDFVTSLESTPNSANHFRVRAQLAVISQKVLSKLYSPGTVAMSWGRAQEEIVALGEEVNEWYRTIPFEYQFARQENDERFCRERILLGFSFYSMKILVNRPCLCRVDRRIPRQGRPSRDLDVEKAQECIMAARSMSDLLPDVPVPNANWIYYNTPWWCIVHHLMQAITIFMLELAFENCHLDDPKIDQEALLSLSRKILQWLTTMAKSGNIGARSACRQLRQQFKGFAPFQKIDTSGLVKMAEQGTDPVRQPLLSETLPELEPWNQKSEDPSPYSVFDSTAEHHKVLPKAEQPDPTVEHDHPRDHPPQASFPQQNTLEAQDEGNAYTQGLPDQPWTQVSDELPWPDRQWDMNVDPLWSTAGLQTSHDLLNPFTFTDTSAWQDFTTADLGYPLGEEMDNIAATGAFDFPTAGAGQFGTTESASDAVMAEAGQQTYHGGFQQDPQASPQQQEYQQHQHQPQQEHHSHYHHHHQQ